MEIIYDIHMFCSPGAGGHLHATLRKTHESNVIPSVGIAFEDVAWKEPRTPIRISCNLELGYYYLQFDRVVLPDEASCEQEERAYRIHGWRNL